MKRNPKTSTNRWDVYSKKKTRRSVTVKRSRKTSGISIFQNTEGLFNFLKKARGDRDLKGFDFRGICMYRTSAFRDLILKGIPSSVRQEIWMLTSGAINEVGRNPIKKNISFQSTFSPPPARDESKLLLQTRCRQQRQTRRCRRRN